MLNTVGNDSSQHWYTHLKHNNTHRAVNAISKRIKQQPEAAEFVPPQKDWNKSQIPRERKQCHSRWSVTTNYQPQQTGFNLLTRGASPHLSFSIQSLYQETAFAVWKADSYFPSGFQKESIHHQIKMNMFLSWHERSGVTSSLTMKGESVG